MNRKFIPESSSFLPLLILLIGVLPLSCEKATDTIRNWGVKSREKQARKVDEVQLGMWERDLNLSRARALELDKTVAELVEESNRQGVLAFKIARAYCSVERYEEGLAYLRAAAQNKSLPEVSDQELNPFEKSLPYYRLALQKNRLDANQLFEAGLCFANASRALGWEKERFRTARFLFERMKAVAPADSRGAYQLAIMLGKVNVPELRDEKLARELLRDVIKRNEYDIAARFAYAHLVVAKGDFISGINEYQIIQTKLDELYQKGNIPGPLKRNQQFRQAENNIEELQLCIDKPPQCKVFQGR